MILVSKKFQKEEEKTQTLVLQSHETPAAEKEETVLEFREIFDPANFLKDRKAQKTAMQRHNRVWSHDITEFNINQVRVELAIRDYCFQVVSASVFINLGLLKHFLHRMRVWF